VRNAFIVEETVVGTELDALLLREQMEALLDLLAAHRSQVHIAPTPAAKEKPARSRVFLSGS
jgi:hypothetical protein